MHRLTPITDLVTPMTDFEIIEYVNNEEYMLGAFFVRSVTTGETFVIEPTDTRFTLYFDNELFAWVLDAQ